MGILLTDVLKCNPEEWSDLLPVVEFVIYTTPGPYGFTPRDIDRSWSSALKLEKDLQPFQLRDFEPVTDYARKLFTEYREIRETVINKKLKESQARADTTNRFRKSRELRVGQKVAYRDPRVVAAGGRSHYRRPLTSATISEVISKTKCKLITDAGVTLENCHVEDFILMPARTRNLEPRDALEMEEVDEEHILLHGDEYTGELSLGDMLDSAEPEVNQGFPTRGFGKASWPRSLYMVLWLSREARKRR